MKRKLAATTKFQISANLPVKPWGNYLFDKKVGNSRQQGLGLFSKLNDELLLLVITEIVCSSVENLKSVATLKQCSKHLFTIISFDPLWRDATLRLYNGSLNFDYNWQQTFINQSLQGVATFKAIRELNPFNTVYYSDYMFASMQCSNCSVLELCRVSLDANGDYDISKDTIPRRSNLSKNEFLEFSKANKPVIITDIVEKWEISKETVSNLLLKYANVKFRAEAVNISLNDYVSYMKQAKEESPLYLFDKNFANSCPELANGYSVPDYFDDLFELVLEEYNTRPDNKWLIIGPARSGSTFHIDPNSTSAWNSVISGAKKWIMYPPGVVPPGVYCDKSMSHVTSPQSLAEWYIHYYDQIDSNSVQCICRKGETVFVPNGWWHCVINLEESIAITQNFCNSDNVANILKFTSLKRDQVSGFSDDLYEKLLATLEKHRPDLLPSPTALTSNESLFKKCQGFQFSF